MEMNSAKEIRDTLNEIDYYKHRLKDIQNCTKLNVTICDGYNGVSIVYQRDDIEVKAIIAAYKNVIDSLERRILSMKWVEQNEQ